MISAKHCQQAAAPGHQVHGGIGFCESHDMSLYSRPAQSAEVAFGDTNLYREAAGRQRVIQP